MVSDFMSAGYGWLFGPNGVNPARRLMKPGKNREGYNCSVHVIAEASRAMDIVEKHYPNDTHRFIYDNAKNHCKRRDNALSAW